MIDLAEFTGPILSRAQELGQFDRAYAYEPKAAPGQGLTIAVWWQRTRAIRSSPIRATSVLLVLQGRVYAPMLAEPQDATDARVLGGAHALIGALHTDLDLGGNLSVRDIDVLGANGFNFEAVAGYLQVDSTLYRVADVTIPIIVDDVWTQTH